MYPNHELARLAARKEALLARVAVRREQCVQAGAKVAVVLRQVDGWREKLAQWRERAEAALSVLSTVLPLLRRRGKSQGRVRRWLRWGTLAWRLAKGFRGVSGAGRAE